MSRSTSDERNGGLREGGGETYLLQLEDVLVEVVLEAFVGEVDAELLEAVILVILEAKDVQDSDGQNLTREQQREHK